MKLLLLLLHDNNNNDDDNDNNDNKHSNELNHTIHEVYSFGMVMLEVLTGRMMIY